MRTLGLFARLPEPGRVKTRLGKVIGPEPAARLYEAFVGDLLDRFAKIGDQRIVGYSPATEKARGWFESAAGSGWQLWPQPDSSLGERIHGFFLQHLKSPDDRVLLIGSDSPTLPATYLDDAWRLLSDCDCVIGPAADGGYWLIGLSGRAVGWPSLFERIDWSTAEVLAQTVARVQEAGLKLSLLPVWYDVDSVDDLSLLRGHLAAMHASGQRELNPRTQAALASIELNPGY